MGILHEVVEEWAITGQDPTENDRAELESPDLAARAPTALTRTSKEDSSAQ